MRQLMDHNIYKCPIPSQKGCVVLVRSPKKGPEIKIRTWSQEREACIFLSSRISDVICSLNRRITSKSTHHAPIRERRRKYQKIIDTKSIGCDDLLFLCQELGCVFAELPKCTFNKVGLGPNATFPFFPRGLRERLVTNIAASYGDQVRRDCGWLRNT